MKKYNYSIQSGLTRVKTNTKKYVTSAVASMSIAGAIALPVLAAPTPGAVVKNANANQNACWGQDRSYYASQGFFPANMDIKQSFPGDVGDQRAAWVATYCNAHGSASN